MSGNSIRNLIVKILKEFYESRTYKALQNTESVLWAESSEFIVDELFREWENSQSKK
jgi:hypothetical protein